MIADARCAKWRWKFPVSTRIRSQNCWTPKAKPNRERVSGWQREDKFPLKKAEVQGRGASCLKTLSPRPTFRSSRDKWGMGVRHSLFPGPALDAHPHGGLPASRRYSPRQAEFRPRSRAVQRLSVTEFQVRLFSSLQLVVAPPAYEPGQDTPAIYFRVLTAWLQVGH